MSPSLETLPVELLLEIFQHVFYSPFPIPNVRAQHMKWTPSQGVEIIPESPLFHLIGTSKHLFSIARDAFYRANTFRLRRTQHAHQMPQGPAFFRLPPTSIRHCITRLHITIVIPTPWHGNPFRACSPAVQNCCCPRFQRFSCPNSDWSFLAKIAGETHLFPNLGHLQLHFMTARPLEAVEMKELEDDLMERGGMSFRAKQLVVTTRTRGPVLRACGKWREVRDGSVVHEELEKVLERCIKIRK